VSARSSHTFTHTRNPSVPFSNPKSSFLDPKFPLSIRVHSWFLRLASVCLLAFATSVYGQTSQLPKDVFVLVDVSGSMTGSKFGIGYSKVQEARNLVRDLLTDRFAWTNYPNWEYSLLSQEILAITSPSANRKPLLRSGSRVFLKSFGDPATSKAPSIERLINDPGRDVDLLFASFPKQASFNDQRTFLWLARGMTRREALERGLSSYLLVEITDAREDKESLVDTDDQVAVREFKSLKHVPVSGEIGAFTHKQTSGEYVLQVNIRLVRLAGDAGASSISNTLLSNLRLPQGLRHGDDAVIDWDSFNASAGLTYTVALTPPSGAPLTQTTQAPPVTFPSMSTGSHTVRISAPGSSEVQGQFDVVPAGSSAPVDQNNDSTVSEILLQTPRKDTEIFTGSVTVSWRVVNPPAGCKYLVTITGPPGMKIPKKTIDGTRASFSVRKAGTYRVRVAATVRGVKPAAGTFKVKSESGWKFLYALLTLLPIAIIAYVGIRHAKKRRHGEDDFDAYSDNLD